MSVQESKRSEGKGQGLDIVVRIFLRVVFAGNRDETTSSESARLSQTFGKAHMRTPQIADR